MSKPIVAAAVQHACGSNKEGNLIGTRLLIQEAKAQGANLILLPELHATPYFCQDMAIEHFDLAEEISGPTATMLREESQGIVLVGSIFEANSSVDTYHNTALVFENGELMGQYRKMHIPDDPGYAEKYYFTPGHGFRPIKTSLGRLGVLICWDQWFPEAARIMALKGADVLLYPTTIGWDPNDDNSTKRNELKAWQTVQHGHAIANHLPVITANRIGLELGSSTQTNFWGHSFICQAFMEDIKSLNATDEGVLVTELHQNRQRLNRTWPFFRDRRIGRYGEIIESI